MWFNGLCLLILFHILKELISTYPARQNTGSTHSTSGCWICLPPTLMCSPVAASSIKYLSVEPRLKARKLFPQVGNKFLEFRIPNSPLPYKVCSENVILVSLDNFASFEYSRMWISFWFHSPLTTFVALGICLPFLSLFLHLKIGVNNSTCLPELLWGSGEITYVQFLPHSRYTVIVLLIMMRFSAKRNRLAISWSENDRLSGSSES